MIALAGLAALRRSDAAAGCPAAEFWRAAALDARRSDGLATEPLDPRKRLGRLLPDPPLLAGEQVSNVGLMALDDKSRDDDNGDELGVEAPAERRVERGKYRRDQRRQR